MPALIRELADASAFDLALAPFTGVEMDASRLAEEMRDEANAPMANNAARRPEGDDWQNLAELTVTSFQRRRQRLQQGSSAEAQEALA